jgi:hypothetical protein
MNDNRAPFFAWGVILGAVGFMFWGTLAKPARTQ